MKTKIKGQLQHHFWGDYHASLGLRFKEEWMPQVALNTELLGPHWNLIEKLPKSMSCYVNSNDLDILVNTLEKLGADREKITSCEYSIDYGEPFEIEMDLNDPRQVDMFG